LDRIKAGLQDTQPATCLCNSYILSCPAECQYSAFHWAPSTL